MTELFKNFIVGLFVFVAIPASLFQLYFVLFDDQNENLAAVVKYTQEEAPVIAEKAKSQFGKVAEGTYQFKEKLKDVIFAEEDDEDNETPTEVAHIPDPAVRIPTPPTPIQPVPYTKNLPATQVSELKLPETVAAEEIKQMALYDDEINRIPLEFADQSVSREDVLNDRFNRLPLDFKIPHDLKERVGFWFDIYTKYSSRFAVVHDSDRPWIIYQVVDVREIYAGRQNRFAKAALDQREVSNAKMRTRQILAKLARKKNFAKLTDAEYKVYRLFETVPGNRKAVFLRASQQVRDQRGQKDFYRKGLMSGSKYLNEMEEIFARYDLPIELTRLPLVESSFNELAQSKVGASGVWQFMPTTGAKYLKMTHAFDERNSPIKATEAAAKLMRSNFSILKNWSLAITAYNHGAGGLIKASKKHQTTNLAEIILKYRSASFSFASQNFYCEFLGALHGERYQREIFGDILKPKPLASETIDLKFGMKTKTLIEVAGITLGELKLYNPDLKGLAISNQSFLPAGYHVRLPIGRKSKIQFYNQRVREARIAKNLRKPQS